MTAIWIGVGIVSLGIVVIAWRVRVQRINADGRSRVSPGWLNENVYEKSGDHRWGQ